MLDEEKEMYVCKLCTTNDKTEEDRDKHKILDHIETHHVKSSYECGECGMILPTRAMINMHKLRKHREDIMIGPKSIAEMCLMNIELSGTAKLL